MPSTRQCGTAKTSHSVSIQEKRPKGCFLDPSRQEAAAISEFFTAYAKAIGKKNAKQSGVLGCIAAALCLVSLLIQPYTEDASIVILANVSIWVTVGCFISAILSGCEYAPFINKEFDMMYGVVGDMDWDVIHTRFCYVQFTSRDGHRLTHWFHVPTEGIDLGSSLLLVRARHKDTDQPFYFVLTPAMVRPYANFEW